jgi:hypothetical protein
MAQIAIEKKINKTTWEMRELIKRSKRKLLELEIMLSRAEILQGRFEVVKDVRRFFRSLK